MKALMALSTPLFDPSVAFMELWMIMAKKVYLTLGLLRSHEEATVDIYASRLLVEKAAVIYLQIAGWDEVSSEASGSFLFKTNSFQKVQHTFANSDVAPGMIDQLQRIVFVKNNSIFDQMKASNGIYMQVACNPRDPAILKEQLFKMAVNELGPANVPNIKAFSKCARARKIIDHRINQKSFVGFKSLRKVVVIQEHPFQIEIKPSTSGRSLVHMTFKVSCFSFKVVRGNIQCRRVDL